MSYSPNWVSRVFIDRVFDTELECPILNIIEYKEKNIFS